MNDSIRLDVWLWAARFFKTRPLATEAVSGGKVHLNGNRVKPGRNIRVADTLEIQKDSLTYMVEITAINNKRRPASEAKLLYKEDEVSIEKRLAQLENIKLNAAMYPKNKRKPDKHQRGKIIRFKREQ